MCVADSDVTSWFREIDSVIRTLQEERELQRQRQRVLRSRSHLTTHSKRDQLHQLITSSLEQQVNRQREQSVSAPAPAPAPTLTPSSSVPAPTSNSQSPPPVSSPPEQLQPQSQLNANSHSQPAVPNCSTQPSSSFSSSSSSSSSESSSSSRFLLAVPSDMRIVPMIAFFGQKIGAVMWTDDEMTRRWVQLVNSKVKAC